MQKFIKRLEQAILNELLVRFKHVFNMMQFDKADTKEFINSRMDIVGDKFVSQNKKMAQQQDNSG